MSEEVFGEPIEEVQPASGAEDSRVMAEKMSSEDIRKEYIDHETSVRSISYLYYLGAVFLVVTSVAGAILNRGDKPLDERIHRVMLMAGIAVFEAWVGMDISSLKRWARIAAGILSGLGLLGIPIGTIINGYILYLLFGKKGAEVFSPSYQRIIAETPDVKGKMSVMIRVCMGLVVLQFVIGMLIIIFLKLPTG
jgi:hypothetical protein